MRFNLCRTIRKLLRKLFSRSAHGTLLLQFTFPNSAHYGFARFEFHCPSSTQVAETTTRSHTNFRSLRRSHGRVKLSAFKRMH